MNCDFDRIEALAEGILSPEEAAQVREHMECCRACRVYYLALNDAAGNDVPPADLHKKIMKRVDETAQNRRPNKIRRSLAAVAACAVLVVGIGLSGGFAGLHSGDSAADMARDLDPKQAQDLPLTVHTVTDAALCAQIRDWLATQEIGELYPDAPREAYDLTAEQVQSLNAAVPGAALPEQLLQLELAEEK